MAAVVLSSHPYVNLYVEGNSNQPDTTNPGAPNSGNGVWPVLGATSTFHGTIQSLSNGTDTADYFLVDIQDGFQDWAGSLSPSDTLLITVTAPELSDTSALSVSLRLENLAYLNLNGPLGKTQLITLNPSADGQDSGQISLNPSQLNTTIGTGFVGNDTDRFIAFQVDSYNYTGSYTISLHALNAKPPTDVSVTVASAQPTTLGPNQLMHVAIVVTNNGDNPASDVNFTPYFSVDSVINGNDAPVFSAHSLGTIAAHDTATIFLDVPLDSNRASGTYYFGAGVTTTSSESNYSNNFSSAIPFVYINPDVHINGTSFNDNAAGSAGLDTFYESGSRAQYVVQTTSASTLTIRDTVPGRDGTDTLSNIERIHFSDATLAFDFNGDAGHAYRLYQAAFHRTPDSNGVSFWVNAVDGGMSLHDVAQQFVSSTEFQSLYGRAPTSAQIATAFYTNVLQRSPDAAGLAYWTGVAQGGISTADLLINFSESSENVGHFNTANSGGILLNNAYLLF